MKKVLTLILASLLLVTAVSCANPANGNEPESKTDGATNSTQGSEAVSEKESTAESTGENESATSAESPIFEEYAMYLTNVSYSQNRAPEKLSDKMAQYYTDLSFTLLQKQSGNENLLLSPFSIATALAMLTNGAEGDTLAQLEDLWGEDVTPEMINNFINSFTSGLSNSENAYLNSANSL